MRTAGVGGTMVPMMMWVLCAAAAAVGAVAAWVPVKVWWAELRGHLSWLLWAVVAVLVVAQVGAWLDVWGTVVLWAGWPLVCAVAGFVAVKLLLAAMMSRRAADARAGMERVRR